MQHYLPEEYEELHIEASCLPLGDRSPVHPFLGLIVNINVVTSAHRDAKDKSFCLVMPIGRFTGGELCLVEPGLVIQFQSGDIVIFPSCTFTHFNLHFQGVRASIILQTDREFVHWREDRNGWIHNPYFSGNVVA